MVDLIKNSSFLVTGGAGFIGSHLVDYLLENGARKVRVLDNLLTGSRLNLQQHKLNSAFEFNNGDIRDMSTCRWACNGIDYVLHQAALGSVPRSIKEPLNTHQHNVDGFLNMLTAAKDAKVKRFIYASSSSVFGDSQASPKKEGEEGKPLSPYAVSKKVNELYAEVYHRTYAMPVIGLRYFNVFGPRQNPAGPYAAVIPLFIDKILKGEEVTINGSGDISRDFTYVANVVQANIKALLNSDEAAYGKVFNVAYGQASTLNQLYNLLCELTGNNREAVIGPQRQGDIQHSLADISKARELLNYTPEIDLKQGLAFTLEAMKANVA